MIDTDARGTSERSGIRAVIAVIFSRAFDHSSDATTSLAEDWGGDWANGLSLAGGEILSAASISTSERSISRAWNKDFADGRITNASTISAEEWRSVIASDGWSTTIWSCWFSLARAITAFEWSVNWTLVLGFAVRPFLLAAVVWANEAGLWAEVLNSQAVVFSRFREERVVFPERSAALIRAEEFAIWAVLNLWTASLGGSALTS
mmetsp:Transcript_34015/g.39657  ORF Transcript_34015/g.39657 Transcript_34015/m.39657 type:complete len:206 (-) Transcript_34015:332-949(-)